MRLRVLGCHGGESPTHRATSFLVDDRVLLDAGSMTRGLSVDEQVAIDHIFVSHAHLDHVRDLGLLADNIFAKRPTPIEIYCGQNTADGLEKDYFNNRLWPDFFNIPNPTDKDGNGMLRLHRIADKTDVEMGEYHLKTVTVSHSIDCQAAFVTDETGATLVYSGDTGPTEDLWTELNQVDDLRAFIFEVSFPNDMGELAKVSGHLTPKMMHEELEKFEPQNIDCPVFIYGMKPGFYDVLKQELADLNDDRLTMLRPMDEYEL